MIHLTIKKQKTKNKQTNKKPFHVAHGVLIGNKEKNLNPSSENINIVFLFSVPLGLIFHRKHFRK